MSGNYSLQQIQRWMQQVITHPDGVAEGVATSAARQEIEVDVDCVEDVVTSSETLTSMQRLNVYGNAYYARLLDCLRDEFPALCFALGDDVFDGMMFAYLQACPSESYTLGKLGARLSTYLQESRPDKKTSGESDQPNWINLMIDLAHLERTYSEVFDGPGVENETPLQPEDLDQIAVADIPNIKLVPVPCLRLLELSFPVHEYASAVRQEQSPAYPEAEPTWLVVTRRDYIVRRNAISENQYRLLTELVAGLTLEKAIASTAEQYDIPEEQFAAELQSWFRQWTLAGYFLQVDLASARRES